ncbi:hypothetical protein [Bacillus thuringiensis]|uniref:hypothetical protein n=1 Tax=Bacillus thuringiensis TaxID=1428 RepID=UPI000BEE4E89|nr:hypothetical protein [Bacillus thuringiensis]PDZ92574.1 hypothetical protein CON47_06360 [Bacillus thuringiensis]
MSEKKMREFKVITAFRDKFSYVHYSVGESYKTDDQERIEFLQKEGFLETEPISDYKPVVPEIVHVGGGYYELPNGEKVKGKEAALKALEKLEPVGE